MVEQPDPSVDENIKIVYEETLSIGREIGLLVVEGTQPVLDGGFTSGDIWAWRKATGNVSVCYWLVK